MKQWYHVLNYSNIDNRYGYGFACVDVVCVAANEKVSWMVGKSIAVIEKFFEGKPALLCAIKVDENKINEACQK